jgi:hypothetical protein
MVHVDENDKIDEINIFLRPAVIAQTLFTRLNDAMAKVRAL